MAGNYHSAKTLRKGQAAHGLNMTTSMFPYSQDGQDIAWKSVANFAPDYTYHRGFTDRLEIGGLIGFSRFSAELDVKYQYHRSPGFRYLAMRASGGLQITPELTGFGATLVPFLGTWQIRDHLRVTTSVFARGTIFEFTGETANEFQQLQGIMAGPGVSFNVELVEGRFSLRPGIELMYYQYTTGRVEDAVEPFGTITLVLHASMTRD